MARSEQAERATLHGLPAFRRGPLQHEVPYRRREPRVGAHRRGAGDRQAQLGGLRRRLRVEVVQHLHVVRDEADRHHDHRRGARTVQGLQVVADVRLQPRDVRGSAARLVDELPGQFGAGLGAHRVGDHLREVQVLLDVGPAPAVRGVVRGRAGGVRGRGRDGVRGEGQVGPGADLPGQRLQCGQHPVDHGLHEAGVVEVVPQLVDLRQVRRGRALLHEQAERVGEVLAVLPTARVRGVRAGREHRDAPAPVGRQLAHHVVQVRGPVAVAPVDRQVQPVLREVLAQRVQQLAVLPVDRADAAEAEVVLPDLLEALARDAAPARDVLQERHDVFGPLGTAEGQQQEGVVGGGGAFGRAGGGGAELVRHASNPATRGRRPGNRPGVRTRPIAGKVTLTSSCPFPMRAPCVRS